MIAELLVFTIVVLVTYLFFNIRERIEHFKSFKKRGIPGPEPDIFFGNFKEMKKHKNKNIVIEKWVKQYGDVVGYYYGSRRYILINDPDIINSVFIGNVKKFYNREDFAIDTKYLIDSLVALKNDRWARVRRILTPIFSYSKIPAFEPEMRECIHELNNEIRKRIRDSKLVDLEGKKSAEFDIHVLTQAFTLDVISRTSFGLKENLYDPDNHLMKIVKEYFQFAANFVVELALLIPFLRNFLTFVNNYVTSGRLMSMMQVKLKEHVKLVLKNHQKDTAPATSVEDEENQSPNTETSAKNTQAKARLLVSLIKSFGDQLISESEFIGNIILILLAGYETTANSVTNALYLLAKHPEIQEKLREEVKKDGLESKYLDMFWYENLRYYPPVTFFVTRKAGEDCEVGGIQFVKDDIAQAPVWLVHRNPNYWQEPDVFKPERMDPEERKNHHPCQFLTYGVGQKSCLGLNFANYEGKLLIYI